MKKRFGLWIALAMLAALIGGCGGEEASESGQSAPPEPKESSVSVVVSEETPLEESTSVPASPAGAFWQLPADTPLSEVPETVLQDLRLIQVLRPEDLSEETTVGEIRDYWVGVSPDDERLVSNYQLMPEEMVSNLTHENLVLQAVGESLSEGEDTVTVSDIQTDGYVTWLEMTYSGEVGGDFLMERDTVPGPVQKGGGSFGYSDPLAEGGKTVYRMFYAPLPYIQLAQRADTPFPYDLDIRLDGYKVETKSAVFPLADNTEAGFVPLRAQLSPLSFAITFSVIDQLPAGYLDEDTMASDMTHLQPVRLLDGNKVLYSFSTEEVSTGQVIVMNAGYGFFPVTEPVVAEEYDYRPVQTLLVCSQEEEREIFPDFDQIDAIEFEGVVYPVQ